MSGFSRKPWQHFRVSLEDFAQFKPVSEKYTIKRLEVQRTEIEPNILAFELKDKESAEGPVVVRLVHGYNMRDCMRIKGYSVDLIEDRRRSSNSFPVEIWRLKHGPAGEKSIWVTGILDAGNMNNTSLGVNDMTFPRIGIPDDPNWVPRGLTWASLKHPLKNTRIFFRSKWNKSRCDVLVFLGLKQPPWASNDHFTMVSAWHGTSVTPQAEQAVSEKVLHAYAEILTQLRPWWQNQHQ